MYRELLLLQAGKFTCHPAVSEIFLPPSVLLSRHFFQGAQLQARMEEWQEENRHFSTSTGIWQTSEIRYENTAFAGSSLQLAASGRQGKQHWLLMQTSYRVVQTAFLLQACLWAVHPKTLSLVSTPWSGFSSSKVENILKIWSPALKSTADHQTKTNQWKHKDNICCYPREHNLLQRGWLHQKKALSHPENFSQEKKITPKVKT